MFIEYTVIQQQHQYLQCLLVSACIQVIVRQRIIEN